MFLGAAISVGPFEASVSNVSGFNTGVGSSGTVTSSTSANASASGAIGSVSYLWELISTTQGPAPSIVSGGSSASPTWRAEGVVNGSPSVTGWRVTITDAAGRTDTADCTVTLTWLTSS